MRFPILVLITCVPALAAAQELPASIESCASEVVAYGVEPPRPNDWTLELPATAEGGALLYFGAAHSRDPGDEQVEDIVVAWALFDPTVAFYEGPDRGVGSSIEETVANTGESGLVRFLAGRDGVTLLRLEPSPVDEADHLLETFPADQIKLFYVLREAMRLREAERLQPAEIRERIANLLERARVLGTIGQVITTVEDLEAGYRRYWTEPAEWWQAPARWFYQLLTSDRTGGVFTNEINRGSSHYRNLHMFRVIASAALRGERVFAVVGRNHVPMQRAALACALDARP